MIAVTVEQSSKYTFKIPDKIVDRRGVERTSGIATAPSCSMRYIENARYLPGEETTYMVNRSDPRRNKISFVRIRILGNRSVLR